MSKSTTGRTPKMEVRVPETTRDAIRSLLTAGESLSEFVRVSLDREIERRNKSKKKRAKQ